MQEDKVAAWARASFCGDHSASAEELEGATLWTRRRREATCTRSPQRAVSPLELSLGQQQHRTLGSRVNAARRPTARYTSLTSEFI